MIVEKISREVWKFKTDANCYLVLADEPLIIDTGRGSYKKILEQEIKKIIDPTKIKKVIFTHLHYDHIGNFDLFKNAEFFASQEEIQRFHDDPFGTVLDNITLNRFDIQLQQIKDFWDFKIISTPGHTSGSICILYKNILFSGDTKFFRGMFGRTDLPTSTPDKINSSLEYLEQLHYEILCPGHEY